MKALISFLEGTWGRVLRIALGLVLIYAGWFTMGDTVGKVIALVGLVPLVMGAWGPCLLGFLFFKKK